MGMSEDGLLPMSRQEIVSAKEPGVNASRSSAVKWIRNFIDLSKVLLVPRCSIGAGIEMGLLSFE